MPTGGDQVRFFTTELAYDGIRMAYFGIKKDTLYLNSVTEVNHDDGLFTVKGCKNAGECDDSNSVFLTVQPRAAHHLWKFSQGKGLFIPDQEIASVSPGNNSFAYVVTSYGSRWRGARALQAYPEVLNIKRIEMPASNTATKAFKNAQNDSGKGQTPGQTATATAKAPARTPAAE